MKIKIFIFSYKKQLIEFLRYPNFFLKSFFYTPITYILPMFFFMNVFLTNAPYRNNSIFTILVCLILWQFVEFSIIETCNISNRELNIGTVEIIYLSPASKISWLLGSSFAPNSVFAISNIVLVFIIIKLMKINVSINFYNLIFVLFCILMTTWALSLIVFVLNLWFKRVFNAVVLLIDIIFIFTGVTYPIEQLPVIFQSISRLIPFTYAMEFIRLELSGYPINVYQLVFLLLLTIVFMVISFIIYNIFERKLIKNGNLFNY